MQTYTGTEIYIGLGMINLIKTFENLFNFIHFNANTTVRNHNFKIMAQRAVYCFIFSFTQSNCDLAVFGRKFEGVGQNIHQHFVKIIHINPGLQLWHFVYKFKFDLSFFRLIFKCLHYIIDKANNICFVHFHKHKSLINFTYIKQLIDKPQDTLRISIHQAISLITFGVGSVGHKFLQRTYNKSHRSSYLMRNIDKELQFPFIYLL